MPYKKRHRLPDACSPCSDREVSDKPCLLIPVSQNAFLGFARFFAGAKHLFVGKKKVHGFFISFPFKKNHIPESGNSCIGFPFFRVPLMAIPYAASCMSGRSLGFLFAQRTVGYTFPQKTNGDALPDAGKGGVCLSAPASETYRMSDARTLFHCFCSVLFLASAKVGKKIRTCAIAALRHSQCRVSLSGMPHLSRRIATLRYPKCHAFQA